MEREMLALQLTSIVSLGMLLNLYDKRTDDWLNKMGEGQ